MKKLALILMILFVIVIAGCGDKCPTIDEWKQTSSAGKCYKYSCSKATDYKVKPILMKGCTCGDGNCDKSTENECNCIEDCGVCNAKPTSNDFLKYQCFNKNSGKLCTTPDDNCECKLDLDESQKKIKTESINIVNRNSVTIDGTMKYQDPLDLKRSTFDFDLSFTDWPSGVENIEIDSIEVYGYIAKNRIKIASLDLNQIIWDETTKVVRSIRPDISDNSGDLTELEAIIKIKFTQGTKETELESKQQFRSSTLKYIKPEIDIICNSKDCNDNNIATADSCANDGTGYCINTPIPNKCGNYVCEASETKCSCATDCGGCQGEVGKYLYKECSGTKCVSKLQPKITDATPITKIVPISRAGPYVIDNEITYDTPWMNIQDSSILLKIVLKENNNEARPIKISSVSLFEGDVRWIQLQTGTQLTERDQAFQISIPLKDVPMQEVKEVGRFDIKVEYEYQKMGREGALESAYESYKASVSDGITLVNPQ